MKKIKIVLIILLCIVFPNIVFASSEKTTDIYDILLAIRSRDYYYCTYVIFSFNATI